MEMQELFRSLINQAGAKTVYADPQGVEGRIVVPVASVRCGFGGGSGKKNGKHEGGGGGGGFVAKPVGYIEISAEGTKFTRIADIQKMILVAGLGLCLGLLIVVKRRREPSGPA
jgi:uncharacterized spore protein YtfJ